MEVPQSVRIWLEAYRTGPSPDTELERDMARLLDDATWAFAEIDVLDNIVANDLPEPFRSDKDEEDPVGAVERGITMLAKIGKRLDQEDAGIFEPEGLAELDALLRQRDSLDVLRMRVVSVVKKAGALAMAAQIDDDRLAILLETLMP